MASVATSEDSYVDLLMREWRLDKQSERFQTRVRKVLRELDAEAQMALRNEPRLEVMVRPDVGFSVWAHFKIDRRRREARVFKTKPETQVLLVFNANEFRQEEPGLAEDYLRDHLGHTLLFLRSPKAWNDCNAAWKEWLVSVHDPAHARAVDASGRKSLKKKEAVQRKVAAAFEPNKARESAALARRVRQDMVKEFGAAAVRDYERQPAKAK